VGLLGLGMEAVDLKVKVYSAKIGAFVNECINHATDAWLIPSGGGWESIVFGDLNHIFLMRGDFPGASGGAAVDHLGRIVGMHQECINTIKTVGEAARELEKEKKGNEGKSRGTRNENALKLEALGIASDSSAESHAEYSKLLNISSVPKLAALLSTSN
jgi:hypothetical protein